MERIDEKGKVYTERVRKTGIEVRVVTTQGYVRGHVHVMPEQRVKDMLNNPSEQFLAVTDATLQGYGEDVETIGFIALNKQYIVSVEPVDEEKVRRQQDGEYFVHG